ncbi:MAG: DPP IV N-terminal domain-containing protein [Planctomycetia bacterium]|nr:DPP IV N-terminal domain-containing protein [Planctomycetia bacterium]
MQLFWARSGFARCAAATLVALALARVAVADEAADGARGTARARPVVKNPEFLEAYAATYRFTHGRPAAIEVSRRGDAVFFLRSGPRSFVRDLFEFDTATGKERLLATAAKLLGGGEDKLTAEEQARRERMRLAARGIATYEVSQDGSRVLLPLSGRLFVVERATGAATEMSSKAGAAIDPRFSPDGKFVACVRDGDVYVTEIYAGVERRLTEGATETLTHGLAEFVAQEEMDRMHGYWWSPDSRVLAYQETDTSAVETLYIADPAHPERPAQSWRYPRPGKNNAQVRLGVVSVSGGPTRWIDWDREAFPYLAGVTWEPGAPLTVLVQNREQTLELLLTVDAESGRTTELLRETDPAWVNLDESVPKWLATGEEFLWSTERRGGWQLELRARDGALVRELTPVDLNYRRLLGIDQQARLAYAAAGENPTEMHVYRVLLGDKGGPPERLTREPGLYTAAISEEGGAYVVSGNTLAGAISQMAYRRDGTPIGELKNVAEKPPFQPNVQLAEVGDAPRMHAVLVRPADFQKGRKYPVVVSVYGGPHSQMVLASRSRYLLDAWLADQGFIVVSLDGRGTPARGRAWERAIKGNLIDVPLADQAEGLAALAAKYPEVDSGRVGIFGWSFGGYFTAMAVTRRPDVFRAGVAGAPVTDWLDYDTHYTERYLGLPRRNEKGYEASSVLTYAADLRRPLLIVHGTADDNVYFLHSVRLADALFRAGREFDFLPLSGLTHMVPDPVVTRQLYTRIAEYFLEHLAAVAPD